MFPGEKLSESNGNITLINKLLYLGMAVKSLFRLSEIVELSVKRRESGLLVVILFRQTELGPHSQILSHKPLENEIVSKAESGCLVPVVQMGIP